MVIAHDTARNLTAQGVPMPGLNGAIHMVPWWMLDDAIDPTSGSGSS